MFWPISTRKLFLFRGHATSNIDIDTQKWHCHSGTEFLPHVTAIPCLSEPEFFGAAPM